MTLRAFVMGLLGAILLAGGEYLRQEVWGFNSMIGNHLPRGLLGLLVVGVLVVNPLMARLRPRWRFGGGEIAVILSLVMTAAGVAGPALMDSFTPAITMPAQLNTSMVGWRAQDLLALTPAVMLPGGGEYDPAVLDGYLGGLGTEDRLIGLGEIPWDKWAAPLGFWMPMVGLMGLAVISMSLIVHRQWSTHERLRYPIADFAGQLITQQPRMGPSAIFRSRMFWVGFAVLSALHLVNGLNAWLPRYVISGIPLQLDFTIIGKQYQFVRTSPWWAQVFGPVILPSAIAFAFFLSSDVGLTLGVSHIIYMLVIKLIFERFDLPRYEADLIGGANTFIRFGGSAALALMLLYTGRRYYWQLLRGAAGLRVPEAERYSVWALRVLVVCSAGMVGMLAWVGLDWPLALLCVLIALLVFLVVSRVNAESGLYMFRIAVAPAGILLALFGGYALGPQALIITGLFSVVLLANTNGAFMPYVVNGLKICDDQGARPGRVGSATAVTFAACLFAAVVVALWTNYNYGVKRGMGDWNTERVPKMTYNVTQRVTDQMEITGTLEQSKGLGTLERIMSMAPTKQFSIATLSGAALVLVLSVLRLRYLWWPLHPFIIVFWGTWPIAFLTVSFLIGWTIKTVLVRLGGGRVHQKGKEMMVGVIAGDVLGAVVFLTVSAVYYLVTGRGGPNYGGL